VNEANNIGACGARAGYWPPAFENLLIQVAGNFAVQDWNLRPFQFFWRLKNYG